MENGQKKIIIWENNSEPPKNYIWIKADGKAYEYDEINGWTTADIAWKSLTADEYDALEEKDEDTLYIVDNSEDGSTKIYKGEVLLSDSSTVGAGLVEITYSELKALRDEENLTPGIQYRITDYVTKTAQDDTQSANHQFDIIVVADSANKLNENARAIVHSGDTYFSTAGCKLESWELKYCIDNDTTRFAWADNTNGKGVIYWMKDEWNNECPYDFKNIQFKRYKIEECEKSPDLVGLYSIADAYEITVDTSETYWCYTFSMINLIDDCIDDVSVYQTKYPSDEVFSYLTHDNVFREYIDTYSDSDIQLMVLPNNVMVTDTDICSIEDDYSYGEFYGFYSNTFGNDVYNNTFGNECGRNTFGNSFSANTFGNYVKNNTFGNAVYQNTFGNYCSYNTFGNNCYRNTFGNYCNNIKIQKDYIYYIVIENGNQYIDITSSQTTSSSNVLRNFTISQGVNNTTTRKTISHDTVNDTFKTTYQNSSSTTINV